MPGKHREEAFRTGPPCIRCGTPTRPWHCRKIRFCSCQCFYAHKRENRPKRTCTICGREYVSYWKGIRTCSQKCGGVLRRKRRTFICRQCGKSFWKPISAGHRQYCSIHCAGIGARRLGVTPDWRGSDWKKQKAQARKRDDDACQYLNCGVRSRRGKAVHVDHIIPYRLHHSNDLVNLMCLCANHHSAKTGVEYHLFKGNRVAFESRMNQLGCPMDRLAEAMVWWGTKPQLPLSLRGLADVEK